MTLIKAYFECSGGASVIGVFEPEIYQYITPQLEKLAEESGYILTDTEMEPTIYSGEAEHDTWFMAFENIKALTAARLQSTQLLEASKVALAELKAARQHQIDQSDDLGVIGEDTTAIRDLEAAIEDTVEAMRKAQDGYASNMLTEAKIDMRHFKEDMRRLVEQLNPLQVQEIAAGKGLELLNWGDMVMDYLQCHGIEDALHAVTVEAAKERFEEIVEQDKEAAQ